MKSLAPIMGGGGRIGKRRWQSMIEASAARKNTLQFRSPTIVKVFVIVGLSLLPVVCLPKKRNRWHPYIGAGEESAKL